MFNRFEYGWELAQHRISGKAVLVLTATTAALMVLSYVVDRGHSLGDLLLWLHAEPMTTFLASVASMCALAFSSIALWRSGRKRGQAVRPCLVPARDEPGVGELTDTVVVAVGEGGSKSGEGTAHDLTLVNSGEGPARRISVSAGRRWVNQTCQQLVLAQAGFPTAVPKGRILVRLRSDKSDAAEGADYDMQIWSWDVSGHAHPLWVSFKVYSDPSGVQKVTIIDYDMAHLIGPLPRCPVHSTKVNGG